MSALQRIGVVAILLVLIVGPLVQIYDCFNDAPVLDHDALLHTVDALFCVVFILVVAGLWTLVLAILRLIESPPDLSQNWTPRTATALCLHPFQSSPPPIRI